MSPAQAWASYSGVILGRLVEDADEKFAGLSEVEQAAWSAVVTPAGAVKAVKPVEVLEISEQQFPVL